MRGWAAVGVAVLFVASGSVVAYAFVVAGSEADPAAERANATVTGFEPTVTVGPDGFPSTDGDVEACLAEGPAPGDYAVTGRVVVERPVGDGGPREATFSLTVALADGPRRAAGNVTLGPGESDRVTPLVVAANEGTVSAGSTAAVELRVRTDGATVAESTRRVEVRKSAGCVDGTGG